MANSGIWHYELIAGRTNGRVWRVADENDDVVTDFEHEHEAIDCIDRHNLEFLERGNPKWRYGSLLHVFGG